jgi:hypothetical protein
MISGDLLVLENDLDVTEMISKIKYHKPKKILYFNVCEFELNIGFVGLEQLENILWGTDIKMYVLLGGMDNGVYRSRESKNVEYWFWPTVELSQTFDALKNFNKSVYDIKVTQPFEKLYLNYTNNPKPNRCMLIDALCKENLFDYGVNTWNKIVNTNETRKFDFSCFEERIIKCDDFTDDGNKINPFIESITQTKTLINLVTESSTDYYLFSEKVWKPILTEQPFIILGAKHQNKLLKKLNFELYDEIFDYSFDNEDSLEKRVTGVIENLKSLKDKDYDYLYKKIYKKIKKNKQQAMDIVTNIPFIPSKFVQLYNDYNLMDKLDLPINVTNVLYKKPSNWGTTQF